MAADKPWDGRFAEKTDALVEAFTASIDVDKRLYAEDIDGSVAHCRMLAKQGVLTEDEAATLVAGLSEIRGEIEGGEFVYDIRLEDIHMHIESRLTKKVGNVARKLHTARSRNDQVALDARLYLRNETRQLITLFRELQKVVVGFSRKHLTVPVAGYTHLQRAQPVLLSHHFMAYYEMFDRDVARLEDCLKRMDVSPLGAAALAGTTYPIDRTYSAELLGFPAICQNSMDAVSDRDFMMEFMAAASIAMVHFSRLSEELILWSSAEFGFIEISDAFTTGSSIMPQKKNPDVCEITRGKTGRVVGNLVNLITLMKSLPLAYNRDMQEDKLPLFDTVDTLKACVTIYTRMIPEIRVNADAMAHSTCGGFINATDMADYLVNTGMPFREAHSVVGSAVSYALSKGKELHELSLEELKAFSDRIGADLFPQLTTGQMIDRRTSAGGTATENVRAAIAAAEKKLGEDIEK
ncbi:MAG: argininosuccinate lyase [Deltaproteobacteria bacterium]|nr:MAG: argininosuccinate lyase [Deltaproteobacteria bacterium]